MMTMLSVQDAEAQILSLVTPFTPERDSEPVDLLDAMGRILATPIASHLDFPHWDNSAMDGYAVRYTDVQDCTGDRPVTLDIVESIPAGYQPQLTVKPGQAARILTGAVMPAGADTVVMQEETRRDGNTVTILAAPKPGQFVRHQGDYYRAGNPLLSVGSVLQATEMAILAAAQCAQVNVLRRPKVAILSTGSELVGIDQPLQPGQLVDSNQYALAALVLQSGAIPLRLGIVPDQPETLKQAMKDAIARADVVLSSGGVSVGDYDYVAQILADLGGTLHIQAVAMKPGKPLTVATFAPSTLYFGLPGNPVSALVTFWRFVQPALHKLAGLPVTAWGPAFVTAATQVDLRTDGKRETYLWGQLHRQDGMYTFTPAGGSHSSGNLINLAQTSGLAMLPVGTTHIHAGERVQVLQVGSLGGNCGRI